MECFGLRCGQPVSFAKSMQEEKPQRINSPGHCQVLHRNRIKPIQSCAISSPSPVSSHFETLKWGQPQPQQPEKLDEWMRDSVTEIVQNIAQAPFLVHVYSPETKNNNTRLVLEREKAVADSWPSVTRRWKQGCPIPDGVILVEQLDHQKALQLVDAGDDDRVEEEAPAVDATGTKAWGVLVQGKGVDTAACYILKTCRVWSSLGFCTHFCLLKAKCFGDTAELQLQNSWNGIDN